MSALRLRLDVDAGGVSERWANLSIYTNLTNGIFRNDRMFSYVIAWGWWERCGAVGYVSEL